MLWLDLEAPSTEELRCVAEALELGDEELVPAADEEPSLEQPEGRLQLTAVGVADARQGAAPESVPIRCFIGTDWILTTHGENSMSWTTSVSESPAAATWVSSTPLRSSPCYSGGW